MSNKHSPMLEAAMAKVDAELAQNREKREEEGGVSSAALVRARFDEFQRMSVDYPHTWKTKVAAAISKAIGKEIEPASVGTEMSRVRKERRLQRADAMSPDDQRKAKPAEAEALYVLPPAGSSTGHGTDLQQHGRTAASDAAAQAHHSGDGSVVPANQLTNAAAADTESEVMQDKTDANGALSELATRQADLTAHSGTNNTLVEDTAKTTLPKQFSANQKLQEILSKAKDRPPDYESSLSNDEDL